MLERDVKQEPLNFASSEVTRHRQSQLHICYEKSARAAGNTTCWRDQRPESFPLTQH